MTCCPATHGTKSIHRNFGDFQLFDDRHRPNQNIGWHEHDDACITFLTKGTYTETYRRQQIVCTAPSILVKPPGEAHQDRYGDDGAQSIVVVLPVDMVGDDGYRSELEQVSYMKHSVALDLGYQLQNELIVYDQCSALIIDGLVRQLFGVISRETQPLDYQRRHVHWIERVRDRLYCESDRSLTVTELAKDEDVHPDHLTRTFKRWFGVLPGQFLRDVRLNRAKRYLEGTKRDLPSIASDCGFADQSHLTRLFKKRFGTTPGAHRTQHRK